MAAGARLWWLSVQRLSRRSPGFWLSGVGLSIALFYQIATAPVLDESWISGLFFIAAGSAASLPTLFGRSDLFDPARWALLPTSPTGRLIVRLITANPLRIILSVILLLAAGGMMSRGHLGPIRTVLEDVQALGWSILVALLGEASEVLIGRRAAGLYVMGTFTLLLFCVQGLVAYPQFHAEIVAPLAAAHLSAWLQAFLLGSRGPLVNEALSAGAILTTCWVVLRVASRLYGAPGAGRRLGEGRRSGRFVDAISTRVDPRAPDLLAKEIAYCSRPSGPRVGLLISAVLVVLGFVVGIPFFLIAVTYYWTVLCFNTLGLDVPYGGVDRYHLVPMSLRHALLRRQIAVVSLGILLLALGAAVSPLVSVRPVLPLRTAVAAVFGLSLYLFATVIGDRVSVRWPKRLGMRDVLVSGGIVSRAAWIALFGWSILEAGLLTLSLMLLHQLFPHQDPAEWVFGGLALASALHLAGYGASLWISWHGEGARRGA